MAYVLASADVRVDGRLVLSRNTTQILTSSEELPTLEFDLTPSADADTANLVYSVLVLDQDSRLVVHAWITMPRYDSVLFDLIGMTVDPDQCEVS